MAGALPCPQIKWNWNVIEVTQSLDASVFNPSLYVSPTLSADFEPSTSSTQTSSYKMETKVLKESKDEVTRSLDAQVFNPSLDVSPTLPADFKPSTSSSQTSSYTMETKKLKELKNEVRKSQDACVFNPLPDILPTLPADFEPSTSSSQISSYKMETRVLKESKDEVTRSLDAHVFNTSLDVSPTLPADFKPSTSSSQTSSYKMETKKLKELKDEVKKSQDARVFNPLPDILPTLPADFEPTTSSSQTSSNKMESNILNDSKDEVTESLDTRVFLPLTDSTHTIPIDFEPSTSWCQTTSIEHTRSTGNPDALKGFLFLLPTNTLPSHYHVSQKKSIAGHRPPPKLSTQTGLELSASTVIPRSLPGHRTILLEAYRQLVSRYVDAIRELTKSNTTHTLQSPVPKITAQPRFQKAHYLPNKDESMYELEKFKENCMIIFDRDRFSSESSRPGTLKNGWLVPADFNPSILSSQTPSTEQIIRSPDSQNGFTFPLPTNTLQRPVPKTTAPSRFQTGHYLPNKDASTYELENFKENRMIIFDHVHFLKGPSRPGTMKDVAILRETFKKFRFKIDPTYENLEMTPLLETVKNFALRTDFSAYGCVCVAILTHGHKEPGFLKAYDGRYSEYDILKHFDASKNPTLAAKPIIFIIQACRGSQPSPKVNTRGTNPAPQLDHGEEGENYHLPTEADRIVFHSSYVGKASVRHPDDGSWFIQILCKKINEYALTYDLETIFRLVRRTVALDCDTEEDWKQMPVVTSTTLRELYLAPSLQHEDEQPRPTSPYVLVCQTKDPDVYPLSHELAERLKEHVCLRESTETIYVPDASPMMQLHHLPCCCFVEYFEYLKSCLESFSRHNKEDLVAKSLLKLVEQTGSGSEYNLQKFSYIQSMWEHLESNKSSFPPDGFSFVHRMYTPLNESDPVTIRSSDDEVLYNSGRSPADENNKRTFEKARVGYLLYRIMFIVLKMVCREVLAQF